MTSSFNDGNNAPDNQEINANGNLVIVAQNSNELETSNVIYPDANNQIILVDGLPGPVDLMDPEGGICASLPEGLAGPCTISFGPTHITYKYNFLETTLPFFSAAVMLPITITPYANQGDNSNNANEHNSNILDLGYTSSDDDSALWGDSSSEDEGEG